MPLFIQFLFLSLCLFLVNGDAVLEFTDKDFKSRVADEETSLVMFYAPWCGHCKRLKPEFEKAAELLKGNDPPISLAKVDCTEGGKETCNQFSVSGYPTLKIFRNGELSQEYNGPREAAGIVKYMQSQVGPSSKELKSESDFNTFTSKEEVAVIGFFHEESKLKSSFLKIADKLREKVRFGHTTVEPLLNKYNTKDGIVLFRPKHLSNKFEPDSVVFDGSADKESIEKFITNNYHGLVGHRTRDTANEFGGSNGVSSVIAYYAVDYVKNPKGSNYWRNRILKVAASGEFDSSQVRFGISAKDEFQHELNEYGVDFVPGEKPIVFARDGRGRKFNMAKEFSVETLQEFVRDLLAGALEPFVKSEPIPEDNDHPGTVKVAVAKNFDEVVTNSGRDALVEFYAPWCGHCKKLAPIYDELAEKLKDEDVDIVKMDATANDVPAGYDVRGFPTIYWSPKIDKDKPVRYEGGREVDDFIKYIAKHSTDGLNGFDRSGKSKSKEEL